MSDLGGLEHGEVHQIPSFGAVGVIPDDLRVSDLAIARNLRVRITGAADSATGSPEKNASLAMERARHVSILMKERGLQEERIEIQSVGGVIQHRPVSANRNCKIELLIE